MRFLNFLKTIIFFFGLIASTVSSGFAESDSINFQYYDDFVINGEYHLVGTGKVDESIAKRIYCFRFKYSNDQLLEVAFIKGKTYFSFTSDGVSIIRIEYRGKDQIELTFYDADERRTKYKGVSRRVIKFSESFSNTYNYDSEHNFVKDDEGIFQYSYRLNEKGLIESKIGKDKKYKNILNNSGVYETHNSYDEHGNKVKIQFLNKDGSLFYSKDDGFAIKYSMYDPNRNETEVRYYNVNESPTTNPNCNCFSIKKSYDKNGRLIEKEFLDVNYHLTFDAEYNAAIIRYTENENFQTTSHTYLYTAGQLTPRKGFGFAKVIIDHDSKGREIRKSYYGIDGQLINIEHGYAIEHFEFDDLKNNKTIYRTDKDNQIIPYDDGAHYSKIVLSYNSDDLLEKKYYLDERNQPCAFDENGVYSIEYEFTTDKFLLSLTYLDRDGNLTEDEDGIAFIGNAYDDQNFMIEQIYYDKKFRVINKSDGDFAIIREVKNKVGDILSQSYFDSDKNPVNINGNGYHKFEFSKHSNEKFDFEELSYYDPHWNLIISEHNSFAKRIRKYDQRGNLLEERYEDERGNLIEPFGNTFALIKREYDEDFNLALISYFDQQESLVNHKADSTGYAIITYSNDENRHWYKKNVYNQEGDLIDEHYKPKEGNLFGVQLFRLLKIQKYITLAFGILLVSYLFFISKIKSLKGKNKAVKILVWFGMLQALYGIKVLGSDPDIVGQFLVFMGLDFTIIVILLSAFLNRKAIGIFYLFYGIFISIALLSFYKNDYYHLKHWLIILSTPVVFITVLFIMNRALSKWKKIVFPLILATLFSVILLHFMFPFKGDKWKRWDEGSVLNEDFLGIPTRNSNYTATIRSKIFFKYACEEGEFETSTSSKMDRFYSWKNESLSEYLLNHEQKHFDITRLYEQKLLEKLNEIENPCDLDEEDLDEKINQIKEDIYYALEKAQSKYDLETEHSQLEEQQIRWNDLISEEISEMDVNFKASLIRE